MNKAWKDIEGMPFRIDVGSTSQQAMNNRTPASVLHLTTDEEIVMNGVKFYDARITKTEDNLAELLKRIQGTSDDSSAYTDPFRFFGEYDTIDDAATALADVNFLDKKNQGSLRIEVGGEIFDVHNYLLREQNIVLGYNVSTCLQTIEGVLSATDGVLVLNDDDKEYKKYCRTISRKRNSFTNLEENIATSWKELYEDEIATIKSDIAANAEAASANASNISKLQDADTKLKKLVRGIADDSSARTDPFLFLGEYDNDDTSTGLEKAMAALNGLDYSQTKYAGLVRLRVNGVPVDVHNYVRGYAAKHITQTIEGAIVVTDGEITSINSGTFAKYWRNIQGENIGKWQKYGESTGNGGTTDLTSVEARLAALEKNCICKNLGYAADWNTVINTIGELENVADYTHPVQLIYQSGGSYTGVVVNTFDGTDCWQTFHWGSVIMRRKIILSGENYSHTAIHSIGDWQTIVSGLGQ